MNIATNSSLESFHPHIATWFREQVGIPTPVQEEGWPVILRGENALLTAPTGTGKTLAAFLAAINRFYLKYLAGESQGGLRVLYLSPLKSLTNDMYHNLQRPIQGLGLTSVLKVAVRNSDTSPKDRRTTLRHPPHILLTTPESLFVLLTAKNGRTMLQNVETVIVDEVHALLDSKRGTHLALSLERLEALVGKPLQRVGLSATVNPVETAAAFLVGFSQEEPRPVQIIAPPTVKRAQVQVTSPVEDMRVLPEGTIWPEICKTIYNLAKEVRTTLVFLNHRAPCEKVAHGINSLYGGAFALTHHGCVSKEQRLEAERLLKAGELRCLCATSSMELGIDVGEVDLVLQVAAPPSVASGLQRMGRAGHTPQSVSVMHLLPRTVADSLACGFIAESVAAGAMEEAVIPQNCLDVLAQHCVSMAAVEEWQVADILQLARQAYPYRQLNLPELETVLAMLYGDYEHREEKPVYPRLNYDRIQGLVSAAPSSRMLALLSGGTIPDRGYYGVVLEDGTRLGELDEVFVFESRLGDRFMLGAFAWQIQRVDRDRVVVKPVSTAGARSPFWQGDWHGRKYSFGKRIGAVMGRLEGIEKSRELEKALSQELMLDEAAAANVARLLIAQREANGCLPTDKRIVVEHFRDAQGNASAVIYMSYGGRVNLGLLMLLEHTLAGEGETVQFMQNEEGLLLHSLDNRRLPAGLLQRLPEQGVPELLRRLLPHNPLFAMVFRYNASRALMMGMRQRGRVPLWVQRLRSDEALQRALSYPDHPLLVETMQDCLENYLDLAGITEVIAALKSGQIAVREVYHEQPSPMAIEYQRMFEGEYMYADPKPEKTVTRTGALVEVLPSLAAAPEAEDLLQVAALPLPEDSMEMHRYLMISGDLRLQDIDNRVLPLLQELEEEGRACYLEPGLWVAAEELELYQDAFQGDGANLQRIIRRSLRYRGAAGDLAIAERYALSLSRVQEMLEYLLSQGVIVPWDDLYVHKDLYDRASGARRTRMRATVVTAPGESYAHYLARQVVANSSPQEELQEALQQWQGFWYPYQRWGEVILPARVPRYQSRMLDTLIQSGQFVWRLNGEGGMRFDIPSLEEARSYPPYTNLAAEEEAALELLQRRGALFSSALLPVVPREKLPAVLLSLLSKGYITNDSTLPLTLLDAKEQEGKAKVQSRVALLESGRWEALPQLPELSWEELLRRGLNRWGILCRETAQQEGIPWSRALDTLRHWEYIGEVRRGYFVRGLSGAQFILNATAPQLMAQLAAPGEEYICLLACDPAQAYGSLLPHVTAAAFTLIPGTAVVLKGGVPVLLIERQGAVMRMLDDRPLAAVQCFVEGYRQGRIWPKKRNITVKNPSSELGDILLGAGFARSMLDFVLYRS